MTSVACRTRSSVFDCCLSSNLLLKCIMMGFKRMTIPIHASPMNTDTPTKRYSEKREITTVIGATTRRCMYRTTFRALSTSVVIMLLSLPVEKFSSASCRKTMTLRKIARIIEERMRRPMLWKPSEQWLSTTMYKACASSSSTAIRRPSKVEPSSFWTNFVMRLIAMGMLKPSKDWTTLPSQRMRILGQCSCQMTLSSKRPGFCPEGAARCPSERASPEAAAGRGAALKRRCHSWIKAS
mmetsp:Transcript_110013/g.350381  ORF Transcript_110013/g.350381 Transcript_110013/m.350381 type:complete len:239 (+) Transcript_110013:3668-4384(+)